MKPAGKFGTAQDMVIHRTRRSELTSGLPAISSRNTGPGVAGRAWFTPTRPGITDAHHTEPL
jgi:hypothetical protein